MDADKKGEFRDLVGAHIIFAIIAVIALLPSNSPIGARVLIAVIAYNVIIPIAAVRRGHKRWLEIWIFVLPISILQIFPDWYLALQLEVLSFPVDGFPMIGNVPIYMAGLWAIPLFIILYVGLEVDERRTRLAAYGAVVAVCLTFFLLAEETLWILPSWSAQNVAMIDHIAIYIIVPEVILGLSTFASFLIVRDKAIWEKLVWAFLVMILYLGAANLSYFIIERLILGT
ncbi:MAG: DUF6989 domain-containing protein [Candidatus Thorarchaeota archaeon]|jgi:hypothetical protein